MANPLRAPAASRLKPTLEQEVILEEFMDGHTTVVSALAGTGKTSTLVLCSKTNEGQAAYWAFNKAIADEAADRMPPRVRARTGSSFAFRAMIEHWPWMKNRLNEKPKPWFVREYLGLPAGRTNIGGHNFHANKLVNLVYEMVGNFCQSDDQVLSAAHVPFVRGLEEIRDAKGRVVVPSSMPDLAQLLLPAAQLCWSDVQSERGKCRFTFDHYMKAWALGEVVQPEVPGTYVMVDEAQDLNPVEIGILRRMDKQLLIVGDANQQIYEFRGSINAMGEFGLEPYGFLPLTMSFRFGEAIADAANSFLELLGAPEMIRGNPAKDSRVTELNEGGLVPDAVLTRSNAGALEMLLLALDEGNARHIAVTGRVKGMVSFIEAAAQMQQGRIVSHPDLDAFSNWKEVQAYVRQTNDKEYALLVSLIDKYGADRLAGALNSTVPIADADLAISTAHSAKGLEWPTVRIGNDFEIRTDAEIEILKTMGERPGSPDPERRLAYVAVTRAEKVLDPGALRPFVTGELVAPAPVTAGEPQDEAQAMVYGHMGS